MKVISDFLQSVDGDKLFITCNGQDLNWFNYLAHVRRIQDFSIKRNVEIEFYSTSKPTIDLYEGDLQIYNQYAQAEFTMTKKLGNYTKKGRYALMGFYFSDYFFNQDTKSKENK